MTRLALYGLAVTSVAAGWSLTMLSPFAIEGSMMFTSGALLVIAGYAAIQVANDLKRRRG